MNTRDLIKQGALLLQGNFEKVIPTLDYDCFSKSLDSIYIEFLSKLSDVLGFDVQFKPNALRSMMHEHWLMASVNRGQAPWDREYVRANYGFTVRGCDFVYYPSTSAKRLVVNFSSMGKDRFDRYSRYWDSSQKWCSDTAYVFFKDDTYRYYLGDDSSPKFADYSFIIRFLTDSLGISMASVYAVGGSMGGYAALFYSISLGMKGCVVAAPQVTKEAALAHRYRNWDKHISATQGQWVDIDKLMHRFDKLPYIYIEYGDYPSDKLAVDELLAVALKRPGLVLSRKADWREHTVDTVLSKETVDGAIRFFEENGFVY